MKKSVEICKILLAVVLATAILCGALVGCSDKQKQNDTESDTNIIHEETDGKYHEVKDHLDNVVKVPNEINRIVICDPYPLASVISVFFDSAEKIVGMAPQCMSAAKSGLLSELYPEILDAKTDFVNGTSVNIEELLKLDPDIVFYGTENVALGEQLTELDVPAVAISAEKWDYDAIETLNNWVLTLSEIFTKNEKYTVCKEYSKAIYDDVQSRVSGLKSEEKKSIFFLFQYSDTAITTSGNHFFGQWWADAIGAINVGEEIDADKSVQVGMEQIYIWNPDYIFITNYNNAVPETIYGNETGNYDWSYVKAVKDGNVKKMPLGIYRSYTCGADTPLTLYWLAKNVYPELFGDIDIIAQTQKYYSDVFGIELTEEQAEKLFKI